MDVIYESLPYMAKIRIKLPINEKTQAFISWIYEKANITDISYEKFVTLSIECSDIIKDKIVSKCADLNGFFLN
jgi:hypothetical protein